MILILINERGLEQYGPFIKKNSYFEFNKVYKLNTNTIYFKAMNKLNLTQYNNWKKNIERYEKVIVFDSAYNKRLLNFLKRKNQKVILWFWNTINEVQEKYLEDKNVDEFYSFDKNDSEKYKIRYNSQFYFDNLPQNNNKIEYDTFFLGLDKGREKRINELKRIFEEERISYRIEIVKDYSNPYKYSYADYIDLESKSKCLIDILSSESTGLTLRPLEALRMKKKLITNNKHIIEYDFYDPENIFVIGKDNFKNISSFINSPYKDIKENIIEKYSINNWIQRF